MQKKNQTQLLMRETLEEKQKRLNLESKMQGLEKQLLNEKFKTDLEKERIEQQLRLMKKERQQMDIVQHIENQINEKRSKEDEQKQRDRVYIDIESQILRDREVKSQMKKIEAMDSMQQQHEKRMKEIEHEKDKQSQILQQKYQQTNDSNKVLMEIKYASKRINKESESSYHDIIQKNYESFQSDEDQKIKENEMSVSEKKLNTQALQAFQQGQLDAASKVVPGFQRYTKDYTNTVIFPKGNNKSKQHQNNNELKNILSNNTSPKGLDGTFSQAGLNILQSRSVLELPKSSFSNFERSSSNVENPEVPNMKQNFHYSKDKIENEQAQNIEQIQRSDIQNYLRSQIISPQESQFHKQRNLYSPDDFLDRKADKDFDREHQTAKLGDR
ncbi:UNKNOWN [Stylonychia lemnae]|uniref:Uncharacterized protein n=1 Tax=Stylonychia lemnae TaxID=5949 RepID=A0A078A5W5_STYLE|nr:UNKNOWN [Stylonychia lemnae]|eukprot:CDW77584.1 UNKNOWN [Stylonychia lemnae]